MADKKDNLTNIYGSNLQARKYLYETGLQNVFNDYEKKIASLDEAKQKSIEDAYYTRELSKKYLGEYASNTGIGDVSGELLDLYGSYQKNRFDIDRHYDTLKQNYDLEYSELKRGYETDLFMTNWAIEQEQLAYKQDDYAREMLYNIQNNNTDGLSIYDYIDANRDKISREQYWTLIDSANQKVKMQEGKDWVKSILTGDLPEGISLTDAYMYGFDKDYINFETLQKHFQDQNDIVTYNALDELKNGKTYNEVIRKYNLNDAQKILLKEADNANRENQAKLEFTKNITSGTIPLGTTEEAYIQDGFAKGWLTIDGLTQYYSTKNDIENQNAIIEISQMTSQSELNKYIRDKGLIGTQKAQQYQLAFNSAKLQQQRDDFLVKLATGNIKDPIAEIKKNRALLGDEYLNVYIDALQTQYSNNASRIMANTKEYKTQEDWDNYIDAEHLKGNINLEQKEYLKGYYNQASKLDFELSGNFIGDITMYANSDQFKENGLQFINTNGDILVESNDVVDVDSQHYKDLSNYQKTIGKNLFAYSGHWYYQNSVGDFIPLVMAYEVKKFGIGDPIYAQVNDTVLNADGKQVTAFSNPYQDTSGNTKIDTIYYDKENDEFRQEITTTFIPNQDAVFGNKVLYNSLEGLNKKDLDKIPQKIQKRAKIEKLYNDEQIQALNLREGVIKIGDGATAGEYVATSLKQSSTFNKKTTKQALADRYFNGSVDALNNYVKNSSGKNTQVAVLKYDNKFLAVYNGYVFDLNKK